MSDNTASLPYHEPSIETLLILSSFIVLLNTVNWIVDKWLFCGLVGQILIGVAWGTPGGQLLASDTEKAIVQLGYIGLILLVFEGGLSTNMSSLRANIVLSAFVALTGVTVPIGLSFVLTRLTGATYLQCFAAGAALCSTSLGTTFAVLRASGLASTRLGVVLTSAAMLDDVAGLVMVQIISNLGADTSQFSPTTVLRPVLVSIAFGVATIVACRFLVIPLKKIIYRPNSWMHICATHDRSPLVSHIVLLMGAVAASSYAGTSNLFAAYIAGAVISWWGIIASVPANSTPSQDEVQRRGGDTTEISADPNTQTSDRPEPLNVVAEGGQPDSTPEAPQCFSTFEQYFHPALRWILQPFFFASVGFSIPITRLFSADIVWKGVVYTVLMMLGKVLCGLWLIRLPISNTVSHWTQKIRDTLRYKISARHQSGSASQKQTNPVVAPSAGSGTAHAQDSQRTPIMASTSIESRSGDSLPDARKPLSLYPASILGLAMVPRGEIGFLISSIAQSGGIFESASDSTQSDIFLIVTWAVMLCTVLGPICVGLLVRRVRRLETEQGTSASRRNVLGAWGL